VPDFPRHAFREGPNGRCAADLAEHGLCGYGRDAAVHVEGMEPRYPEVPQPDVDRSEVTVRRAVPLRPTEKPRRKPVPWSDLPVASRLVIALLACGAVPIFAALVAAAVALILRAGGLV